MNDPRVQVMLKRSRHNKISNFIISQDKNELPKKTIRANGKLYHIFQLNIYREVQNLYRDQFSIDMTLQKLKNLLTVYWNKKYQTFAIDMAKDKKMDDID